MVEKRRWKNSLVSGSGAGGGGRGTEGKREREKKDTAKTRRKKKKREGLPKVPCKRRVGRVQTPGEPNTKASAPEPTEVVPEDVGVCVVEPGVGAKPDFPVTPRDMSGESHAYGRSRVGGSYGVVRLGHQSGKRWTISPSCPQPATGERCKSPTDPRYNKIRTGEGYHNGFPRCMLYG